MFRYYRTLLVFISLTFFIQLLYSIVKLQIRKQSGYYGTLRNTLDKSLQQLITSVLWPNNATVILNVRPRNHIKVSSQHAAAKLRETLPRNITVNITRNNTKRPDTFINASFIETLDFSVPDIDVYFNLSECKISSTSNVVKNSVKYRVNVSTTLSSYTEIERKHSVDIHFGGHWYPSDCQAKQRLAIIICYRQREQHLKMFLNHMHWFLKQQKLDYTIIVVNQHGNESFNRGALFNVGFVEAIKLYPFTCFIFHDVDLLPEDLRNIYKCGSRPKHMSVAVDKFKYKLLYPTLFGGVTAFHTEDFIQANGYPNVYWGWGNEDDDMYFRVIKNLKKNITRSPIEIARYKMIRTHGHKSGKTNPHRDTILHSKYNYSLDGLNTIQYSLHQIRLYHLFVLVNASLVEESYEQIRNRLNIVKKSKKSR
ncbi:unnamed protein product [Rotaria socialis]|uniref:Beta-1,4-galactosyltransferase n=1 Tax=Rotaria socialis TaxID=392032 RepID=A0A818V738_9BILA|nr:unnamed protein product [Rotaria socialis]CAF3708403.1 unnamed protein product [Rotaria socialis]CAF4265152.1 unnamed protein product [Rotaria socialis]CAF4271802.1 unnamed protein product [Rotaria socialis]